MMMVDSRAQLGGATVCPGLGWQGSIAAAVICAASPHAVAGLPHSGSVVCQSSFCAMTVEPE